jgi:hypothetical protein
VKNLSYIILDHFHKNPRSIRKFLVTQEKLKLKIETAGKECSMSVFIIDEMDKLLPGLIDTIRPYVDYYDQVEGTYYKKLLFLFLR